MSDTFQERYHKVVLVQVQVFAKVSAFPKLAELCVRGTYISGLLYTVVAVVICIKTPKTSPFF